MIIKCTCLATTKSGKWHSRHCPRYKAYADRLDRARIIKESDAKFERDFKPKEN